MYFSILISLFASLEPHLTAGVSESFSNFWMGSDELLSRLPPLDSLFFMIRSFVKLHLVFKSHYFIALVFLGLSSSQRIKGLFLGTTFFSIGNKLRFNVINSAG